MNAPPRAVPKAAILGCSGPSLTAEEASFFADADPLGFILFARNVKDPGQVEALVHALRDSVNRPDAPVLVDQEGGRVQRLGPPHWPAVPAARRFGELYEADAAAGVRAAWLNARLVAHELAPLGITVNCAPVLDLPADGADPVIGDRAFNGAPEAAAALGRAAVDGFMAGGVTPVVKHAPGHGRANVDSHAALPVVETPAGDLEATDFAPFRALRDAPWGMTAHVVYAALDGDAPVTSSAYMIGEVIRGRIGFTGVLISDDLSMKALSGGFAERARAALGAGCDLVLHCNGEMDEMIEMMAGVDALRDDSLMRLERGAAMVAAAAEADSSDSRDFDAMAAERDVLLAGGGRP